jgi:hypothetical protein
LECPRSDAVSDILDDSETEHIVRLDEDEFTVRHPLRERLGDELMRCPLHRWIRSQDGPPYKPGQYRVVWRDGAMHATWTPVPEPSESAPTVTPTG